VIRPADANETAEAWRVAGAHRGGPVALALTRQKLPFIEREGRGAASELARGAYVLADSEGGSPQVVLMASGSEVSLVLDAQQTLAAGGIRARVVSVPSHELFAKQPPEYRASVLPPGVRRVAIEAAHPMSWRGLVGDDGMTIGIEQFGHSAPYQRIYEEYGITAEAVVDAARRLVT
jgi:transketolase